MATKIWRIKHNGFGRLDEVEANTKAQARKLWLAENAPLEIESIEEKQDITELYFKATEKIVEALKPTKHLEVDDSRANYHWFVIPVYYVSSKTGQESDPIREFRFCRDGYETEAEMVERFESSLDDFLNQNWKRIDK